MPETVERCVICHREDSGNDAAATVYLNLPKPFAVVKCRSCDFRWLCPRPTADEYNALYSGAYFSSSSESSVETEWLEQFPPAAADYIEEELPARRWLYEDRVRMLRAMFPAKKRILDVGAATGEFLSIARRGGFEPHGLELSEYACRKAVQRHGLRLEHSNLLDFEAGDRRYDIVHLHHVFEHLTDPVMAVTKLHSLMADDAIVVIEVPNQFDNWPLRLRRFLGQEPQKMRDFYSIHHPYFYTLRHLVRLLNDNRFEILRARSLSLRRRLKNKVDPGNILLGLVGYLGDVMGGHGEVIEVLASAKKEGPILSD